MQTKHQYALLTRVRVCEAIHEIQIHASRHLQEWQLSWLSRVQRPLLFTLSILISTLKEGISRAGSSHNPKSQNMRGEIKENAINKMSVIYLCLIYCICWRSCYLKVECFDLISLPAATRYFSLLQKVQTGPGTHPASYSMSSAVLS
jgi:hypothetical protein